MKVPINPTLCGAKNGNVRGREEGKLEKLIGTHRDPGRNVNKTVRCSSDLERFPDRYVAGV